ncbi:MAG TPA: hypothetical protein VET48_10635 [Steroidobacteraceae bacterium]|nr:hypothetical protein [Steroidobacteraceae bacterium]
MKALMLSLCAVLCLSSIVMSPASAEDRRQERREEWREHPRVVKAVEELEDAIKYMEAAPNDFGGHKAAAIAASREAIRQLRLSINYRVREEERHER